MVESLYWSRWCYSTETHSIERFPIDLSFEKHSIAQHAFVGAQHHKRTNIEDILYSFNPPDSAMGIRSQSFRTSQAEEAGTQHAIGSS
jgi:hypothetical protein